MGTGRVPDGTGFLILGSVTVLPKGMGPEGSAICTKLGEFGAYVYSSEQRSFILKGVRDPITPRATAVKIKSILTILWSEWFSSRFERDSSTTAVIFSYRPPRSRWLLS